jgi:hypothetical protein
MDLFNVRICSCERCISSEQYHDSSVSFFLSRIYEIIMASCTATLLTAVKKPLKLSNIIFNYELQRYITYD